MPKPLYLFTALWDVDTKIEHGGRLTNQVRNLDADGRYRMLATVVQTAWMKMLGMRLDVTMEMVRRGADWVYLFVAPEYLFAASDSAHAVPQATKETIVRSLMALSGHYANLLLVPGTIAWKKQVRTDLRLAKYLQRILAAEKRDVEAVYRDFDRQNRRRLADAVGDEDRIARLRSAEYRRQMTEAPLADVMRSRSRYDAMSRNLETASDRTFVARNTAYGFYGGREVARYHKRGEYMEVFPSESDGGYVIYEPGGGPEGAGDRFKVENVKFGIEVCMDHQLGFLSASAGVVPDVHVIMSADTPLVSEYKLVADPGYIVHASSNPAYAGIWKHDHGALQPVATTNEDATLGRLRYAQLELQVTPPQLFPDD